MASISSLGIGSGLDLQGLLTKLISAESQPLTTLAKKEAAFQAKLSAFGSIKGALASFKTSLSGLTDANQFLSLKASSSTTEVATATATTGAATGSYSVDISQVAKAQKLVAAGQSNTTSAIGDGSTTTITIDFGTISGGSFTAYDANTKTGGSYSGASFASNGQGSKTITIDSSNNTLTGIRDAINAAEAGVTATIVNDGGTSPYRLVLTSKESGESQSMRISVSGNSDISTLLSHDPTGTQALQETVTAQNTELMVDGLSVSKPGTVLTDVIDGVTLNVLKAGTSTVSVSNNTSGISTAVNKFIASYNDLNTTLKQLTAYDTETKTGAVLLGDATVRSIQTQMRNMLNTSLKNNGNYSTLSSIGISFQANGSLSVDTTKLNKALADSPSSVAGLFSAAGTSSDSLVKYVGAGSNTKAGKYDVDVTQLATQGTLVGNNAVAGLVIADGVNDALNVAVDGVTASIRLTAKTYASYDELAGEIQSKINGATTISSAKLGVKVSASVGGVLTITSNSYGSNSKVTASGNAASDLFGTTLTTAGLDAAGTIGGTTATGSGQFLTADSGSGAAGLKLQISGGTTGSRGTISFSQGFAFQLDSLMGKMLDGKTGLIANATDSIDRNIDAIEKRRDRLNTRLEEIEARYRKQFAALDSLIAEMNQTSNYLSQQLSSLSSS